MSLEGCKLTYFPAAGRAEPIRIMLSIAGIEFEDERIGGPDWVQRKPSTPWGSMPVLTLTDGTELNQSAAIARFVAKHAGLYPTDFLLAERCDELLDAIEDTFQGFMAAARGLDGEEKIAKRKEELESGKTAGMFSKLDAYVAANGKNGFAVGDTLTLADVQVAVLACNFVSGFLDGVTPDALDKYENLMRVKKNTFAQEGIKNHYATRMEGLPDSFKAALA